MIVYGSEVSYFTGKFEAYLRFKEIPYERRPMGIYQYLWRIPRKVGVAQLPTVELPGGRWMTDTTPMIAWLEQQHPAPAVIPEDPVQALFALLIEDFGDEWLWRPAMHYRWNNAADRELLSRMLATELIRIPLPLALRRRWIAWRQARLFVRGDGVDRSTRPHMDAAYTRVLDRLEPVFAARPFLFGERPTVADFGLFGSMFRHFALDPTPGRIMRDRAPAVYRWVARVWGTRASEVGGRPLLEGLPDDLGPLLRESGETHLEMLAANAEAHGQRPRPSRLPRAGHDLPGRADLRLPGLGARAAAAALPAAAGSGPRAGRAPAAHARLLGTAVARGAARIRARPRPPRALLRGRPHGPRRRSARPDGLTGSLP